MNKVSHTAHPSPDFARADTQLLNGSWQFAFDDEDQRQRPLGAAGAYTAHDH